MDMSRSSDAHRALHSWAAPLCSLGPEQQGSSPLHDCSLPPTAGCKFPASLWNRDRLLSQAGWVHNGATSCLIWHVTGAVCIATVAPPEPRSCSGAQKPLYTDQGDIMMSNMQCANVQALHRPSGLPDVARSCLPSQPLRRAFSSPAVHQQVASHPLLRQRRQSRCDPPRANFFDVAWGVTGDVSAQVALPKCMHSLIGAVTVTPQLNRRTS